MSYPVLCGAVVLTSANNQFLINEGATTSTVTIPAGTYYLRGSYTTNYCTYSEDFTLWTKVSTSINPQEAFSPRGGTAYMTTATSAGGYMELVLGNFGNGSKGVSFFLKKGTSVNQGFRILDYTVPANRGDINISWSANNVPSVVFTAGTGTVLTPVHVGDGWWRIKVIFQNLVGANNNRFTFYPAGYSAFAGLGTSFVWGFQIESNATVRDYVTTTTAVATGPSDDLALAMKNAMEAAGASTNTYDLSMARSIDPAVSHSILTVTTTGPDSQNMDLTHPSSTFDERLIGFASYTAYNVFSSTFACAANWVGNDVAREIEPYSDRIVSVPRAASGRVQGVSRSSRMQSWRLGLSFVDERRILIDRALSVPSDTLEGFMERFGAGASFELHEVQEVTGTTLGPIGIETRVGVMHFSEDTLTGFRPQRIGPGVPLYSVDLTMHAKV